MNILKKIWYWFSKQKWYIKTISLGIPILLIVVFIIASVGIFGIDFKNITKSILQKQISSLFNDATRFPLFLNYGIKNSKGERPGKQGDLCFNGDEISLTYEVGMDCWITIVGIDKKSIHVLMNPNPDKIIKEKYPPKIFKLDTIVGLEVYYVIAFIREFSYVKDVEPELLKVHKVISKGYINAKGPVISNFDISLKNGFVYQYIYFQHSKK